MHDEYDVAVVGGGPAGASAAVITAAAGFRTLLVERESVPRFHVGESLMPETYWPLERIGVLNRVREMGFQTKSSVQFVTHTGKESEPFFFRQHDARECSQTWQVERSEFDKLLFDRASELGADCYDRTRLLDVLFDGDRAVGVRLRDREGRDREIRCQVVVDGTGQQAVLANRLNLKQVNPQLKKAAIWGYWRDAQRDEGENAGATIILLTESKDSWFWFIPLSRGVTSIGCVGNHEHLLKGRGTPEQVYDEELRRCPGLVARLKMAERIGEFKVAKEFSYTTTQHAGPGWVLVGDAFGFIDPVYSSGVYLALETGVRAGDAIVDGLRRGDTSAAQLGRWTENFEAGVSRIRELVGAFYNKDFSVGRFMKNHPQHRGNLTDLLIGRVFGESTDKIFEDMRTELEAVKKDAAQIDNAEAK